METKYSTNSNQVVFLKDTDLIKNIDCQNFADDIISTNPVASFDLVSSLSTTSKLTDDALSGHISTLCGEVNDISTFISGEVKDLSGKFADEQTYNVDALRYYGDVKLKSIYKYNNVTINDEDKLYGLLLTNSKVDNNPSFELKKGFVFRTSADVDDAFDFQWTTFTRNTYLIVNKDVPAVHEITSADVDIVRDYDLSVAILAAVDSQMRTDFNALTNDYSTTSADFEQRISDNRADITALQTSASTISADLTSLSGKFNTHVEAYNQLCTDLSNAITATTDILSNTTSGLVLSVENEITDRICADNYISDYVSNYISTEINTTQHNLATSAENLTTAIESIRAEIKGGVNYKGHLKLTDDALCGQQLNLTSYLSAYYFKEGKTSDEIASMGLSNGWMYYIDFNPNASWPGVDLDKGTFTTLDGVVFVPGNYIIVHSHDASYIDGVPLTATTIDNIDIIKVTDSDLVRFNDLQLSVNDLCGILSNEISTGRIDTSSWVKDTVSSSIYQRLTIEINARETADQYLSDVISNETSGLCGLISTISSNLDLSASWLDRDIKFVSNELSTTVSNAIDDKVQISVFGNPTLTSVDKLKIVNMPADQYAAEVAAGTILSDAIYNILDKELNAFNERIVNVAAPSVNTDATNKKYVDDNATNPINELSGRFNNAFTTGADYDERLTLFNNQHESSKYQLLMLSGTLVLRQISE